MKQVDEHAKARRLVSRFKAGMLATVRSSGEVHSRPMFVADSTADRYVTFITSVDSQKVDEVLTDEHVCVTFQEGSRFLALAGTARISRDREMLRRLWTVKDNAWFSGPDDPRAALIRVDVHSVEYWDEGGVDGVRDALRAMAAVATGARPTVPR